MIPDVIILGAGMAGASLAAEIAAHRRVLLLETEDQPGRHTTGRSAAMYFESYGNATVRALTRASRGFLLEPPSGFADVPLMTRRDGLVVADHDHVAGLAAWFTQPPVAEQRLLTAHEVLARVPVLRAERVAGGLLDLSGHDMDVARLHQGYLRAARRAGARVVLDAGATMLERRGGLWQVDSRAGRFEAPVVVNATGAWADEVAVRADVRPIGLQPLRRTVITLPAPAGHDSRDWPMVIGADESYYFKPDAGQWLLSPANEDPMPPCDVVPEELDVAVAVDRFEAVTTLKVTRINHRWAGLRSFVADRSPVAGYDDRAEGFFWLAGQGGYGIQMAPGLARAAAALLLERGLPEDLLAEGVTAADLSPRRPALQSSPAVGTDRAGTLGVADLPFSPAAQRNAEPILATLRAWLPKRARILELASGTGQHAQHLAAAEPGWDWQPSEGRPEALPVIAARSAGLPNVRPPLVVDVLTHPWPFEATAFDAVYVANLLHIAPWEATAGVMQGAARCLMPGGSLVVYGPFGVEGEPLAPSNVAFDADLRLRDPRWGLRSLSLVERAARAAGLVLVERRAMPANNLMLRFSVEP